QESLPTVTLEMLGKKQGVQDGQGDHAQAVDKNSDAINLHEQKGAEHHDQTPHWPWTIQIPLQKYRPMLRLRLWGLAFPGKKQLADIGAIELLRFAIKPELVV
ncbi:hypothetical protein PV326_004670, partial [Microctonus aethiopoides]